MKITLSLCLAALFVVPAILVAQDQAQPAPKAPVTTTVPSRKKAGDTNAPAAPAGQQPVPAAPAPGQPAVAAPRPANAAAQPAAPAPTPAGQAPTTTAGQPANAGPGAVPPNVVGAIAGGQPGPGGPGGAAGERPYELKFQNAELIGDILPVYAELVNRTVLRPGTLPEIRISIMTQNALTKEEAIQALDTLFALNGITTIPIGEKFITLQQSTAANTEGAAFLKSTNSSALPEASQFVTQIMHLTNLIPSEAVQYITPFAKNPTGIVPIDANRVLILRDYAINVKRMMEVIEQIDVAVPADVKMELIYIKYAIAADIANVLGSLSGGGVVGGTGTTGSRTTSSLSRRPSARTLGAGGQTGIGGTGSTGFGGTGNTGFGGNTGGIRPQGTTSFSPQAGGATPAGSIPGSAASAAGSFQNRLNQIVNRAAQGESALLGEAKIIPDERTNAILVFGTNEEIKMIKEIIAKLDVVQSQVLIEAIIMEVTLDDTFNLGVSFAQNPKSLGGGNLTFGGSKNVDFGSSITNALPGGLPNGFSYYGLLGRDWEVAFTALATDGKLNVLSRPRLQTSHAIPASLFVGQTVPFVTGSTTDINGGARSQFQNQPVGISMEVTPLINEETNALVVLDIAQTVEQLGTPQLIDGNDVPTTISRNATTRVAVRDGETVMIGGFISSTKRSGKSGVPYLKDIPLLGALFRTKTDTNQRVELIILIKPTVLRNPEQAALMALEEKEKLWGVRRAEQELLEEEKAAHEKDQSNMEKRAKDKARK